MMNPTEIKNVTIDYKGKMVRLSCGLLTSFSIIPPTMTLPMALHRLTGGDSNVPIMERLGCYTSVPKKNIIPVWAASYYTDCPSESLIPHKVVVIYYDDKEAIGITDDFEVPENTGE